MCLEQAAGMFTWRHPASATRRLRIYFYSNSWKQEGAFLKKSAAKNFFDRVLALFDPLLSGAALVIELDDAVGRPAEIGDDKADTGVKFTGMPFNFCHNPARFRP
jgi:hypothetical protein